MNIRFIGTRGVPASYSGFETCVEQVGYRMVERGHNVEVFCRSSHYPKHLDSYRGMRLRYLPSVREKHLDTLTHTALSALRVDKSTAIVCMGVGNAPVVRALEMRGRRSVFNVDGADWQREKWGRFARWYLRRCELVAVRSSSMLVADAETVQNYYATEYGRETALVAYGADAPADRGTETLARFGLEHDGYALFVGRLVPENGAHDFLEGMGLAETSGTPVVVGDAPFERAYVERLRSDARAGTVFTGYQFGSSYQQLSSHTRVFVLAASVGGTHPVLLEQMAAGNCILARDTSSNREVLADAGMYWKTPAELAALLRATWNDGPRRQELGISAQARAASRYSWDAVTDRYLELCEATLK